MQWTVQQMIEELAHLDAQYLSYVERAKLQGLGNEAKLKTIRKWMKAGTEMMCLVLAELHELHPALHDEIVNEQADMPANQRKAVGWDKRFPRDSLN